MTDMPPFVRALRALRPGAEWTLRGESLAGLEWHDKVQSRPADAEIKAEAARPTPVEADPVAKLRDFLAANPDVATLVAQPAKK